jgi:HAD superfamily hydrolase (TIGR01509 family)
MIKNIVFDLGRVLISFKPEQLLQHLLADPSDRQALLRIVFQSPEWFMLDRGVITQEQAAQRLINQHPQKAAQIQMVLDRWLPILTPIESSVELVRLFKEKGLGLYVISNFHRAAFDYIWSRYPWLRLFDGMVISCETQTLKPEPAIYQTLLEKYSLNPAECLFIDDSPANVEGARQMGMHALQYISGEQIRRELEAQFQLLP